MEQFMRTQPERVKYIECSLKNGYGLRQLYNFLNVPFLKMKLSYLQEQVIQCKDELTKAEDEMELVLEQDYDSFLKIERIRSGQISPTEPKAEPITAIAQKIVAQATITTTVTTTTTTTTTSTSTTGIDRHSKSNAY